MYETEFLIVGAGIVGLTLARELLAQGATNILILEKEKDVGFHASGRNSGVLHAGIYYPPNTLKAKLCLKGNLLLQEYCRQKNLPLENTGKVIVTRNEAELPTLIQLYERAKQNGAKVDLLDEKEARAFEPFAKTCQKALYSHYTALIDNKAILQSLKNDLLQSNKVKFLFETKLENIAHEFTALTSKGKIHFKQLINAAGAYADTIAHLFDVGKGYFLIPFKGIYRKLIPEKASLVNGNIYPVPNLHNPFLGVHFTKNVHGDTYVGPTAIPAFGRENYGLLQGIDAKMPKIVLNEFLMYCKNAQFRKIALEETKKYLPRYLFNDAKKLVRDLDPSWLTSTNKVGIRPQLINTKDKTLMMDFLVIKERHTLHILNAISPAFTSSMAFAQHVVKEYL